MFVINADGTTDGFINITLPKAIACFQCHYLEDLDMTAELFLGLIIGIPVRLAGMGMIRDSKCEKSRVNLAVELFMDAVRRRQDS